MLYLGIYEYNNKNKHFLKGYDFKQLFSLYVWIFFSTFMVATEGFSCLLGVACTYDTQIKACFKCRNIH